MKGTNEHTMGIWGKINELNKSNRFPINLIKFVYGIDGDVADYDLAIHIVEEVFKMLPDEEYEALVDVFREKKSKQEIENKYNDIAEILSYANRRLKHPAYQTKLLKILK